MNFKNKFMFVGMTCFMFLSVPNVHAYEDRDDLPSKERSNDRGPQKKFNKDGDNQISYDEAPGKMKQNFSKHDLDGDGYISGDEFDTLPKHPPRGRKKSDSNEEKGSKSTESRPSCDMENSY